MSPNFLRVGLVVLFTSLSACAGAPAYLPDSQPLEPGQLPAPNTTLQIPGLGPCTDSPDRRIHLNAQQPVTVLVHGCKGSAGRFRSLAQLYAFHGQQAVCFSYDDRESLIYSSGQLVAALDELASHMQNRHINVMGHSMGGLVARKALERDRPNPWQRQDVALKLLTISAPFAGIEIAETCGSTLIQWLSLGTVAGICKLITGDNWYEITSASDFIQRPGPLLDNVAKYLKVVTNEHDSCRQRSATGRCLVSDYVFSLNEQYQPVVDNYQQVTNIQVEAGHVEIVGDKNIVPRKLLMILQQEGMLASTPPARRAALERLLANLY